MILLIIRLLCKQCSKRRPFYYECAFKTPSSELDEKFIAEAEQNGLKQLKGHRLVGGMRASIYNAMPIEGVKKLVEFMKNLSLRTNK